MKLLRVGDIGKEIPALLGNDNKIRSLKNYLNDFDPSTLIFEKINKIKTLNAKTLPEISSDIRIGSCISNPEKFIGIGLNFSDHAAEQGLPIPKEPIVFAKATSSIIGPYDDVIIPSKSNKTDWEVEIAFVVGKKAKNVSQQRKLFQLPNQSY
jgi:2-keto-4-pentenoate hydratase/2-oxohepta-3-ene-1,7-dioic acid hydratase in catechol pathway